MSFQILQRQETYYVNGTLDSQNADRLGRRLSKTLQPAQQVILNLEKVVSFDTKAAFELLKMFIKASHNNSKFYIIGKKNENLIQVLKETETFHIWHQTKILR